MHLYRFRFGLVSYASKCRLVTCESSLCPFRVSLLTSRFKPSYFVLLWSALVQGNCFPLEDLLAELKTDQTLKLRLQGKATGKNCTGNNEIPVSIQSCLVFFFFSHILSFGTSLNVTSARVHECTNSVNYFHRLFMCLLLPRMQWPQMLKKEERPQENAKLPLVLFTSNTGGSSVPCAILVLKGH